MVYQAPRVTEVGSVRDLTLGLNPFADVKDNNMWFPLSHNPTDPKPPVGSR